MYTYTNQIMNTVKLTMQKVSLKKKSKKVKVIMILQSSRLVSDLERILSAHAVALRH